MGITTKTGLNENGQSSSVFEGRAIGDIIPHFGTTAPPGTLICDGSEVSREAYAELYEEIGSLVGQGDGSTTFELPDLRGRWMMGADAERAAGAEVEEGLPNITGAFAIRENGTGSDLSPNATVIDAGAFYIGTPPGSFSDCTQAVVSSSNGTRVQMDASRSSAIYGASDHVTPASVAVLPCIVYE